MGWVREWGLPVSSCPALLGPALSCYVCPALASGLLVVEHRGDVRVGGKNQSIAGNASYGSGYVRFQSVADGDNEHRM